MHNIKDIALLANVSVSTVSRVLNNHPHVSEETREIVLKVIKDTNYTVNRNAVKLSTGKTNIIGVVVSEINHECYDTILQGVLMEAETADYNVMVLISNYSKERELKFLELLKNKEVDGLIFVSKVIEDEYLIEYSEYGALANCKRNNLDNITNVYPNRLDSYYEVYEYFKALECDPVFVATPKHSNISQSTFDKARAYRNVYQKSSSDYLNGKILTYEDGYHYAKEMFAQKQEDVKIGIHVCSNSVAAGIMKYAEEKGYSLNEDFLIVGEEDSLVARLLGIRSIEYHLVEVGALLFKSLFDDRLTGLSIDYSF